MCLRGGAHDRAGYNGSLDGLNYIIKFLYFQTILWYIRGTWKPNIPLGGARNRAGCDVDAVDARTL